MKPNVILILADDLGPGMLGCYGQDVVTTPNIDRLAAEGIKFSNFYSAVFCAPARWTLLTGMHDGRRGGWAHSRAGLPIRRDAGEITEAEYQQQMAEVKANAHPIPDHEVFLAQIAQQAGYKTAQFGKLDRGFLTWDERVRRMGWDFHEGYYDHVRCHGFYPPYLWRNGERFELEGNAMPDCGKTSEKGDEPIGYGGRTYSQNVFIEEILKYIREHSDEPFFLYHPTQLPHGPVAIPELHPEVADHPTLTLAEKKYASMVKMLDDHVGLILGELKKQGMDQRTIVLFASDNGHEMYYGPKWTYGRQEFPNGEKANLTDRKWRTSECGDVYDGAGGRAGLKRSGYQGGMQCPMIARWPGHIEPGTETGHLSAQYDFLATLADLVGVTPPSGKDSISYLPTLLGQTQQQTHDYVVVYNRNRIMGSSALITRDGWKLVEIDGDKDHYQLYNIRDDNEERFNLEDRYPEKVVQLKEVLRRELNSERPDLRVDEGIARKGG
ncbi:MAG: arylsulfatase [Lentisphaerae bacterium]|jgi:arylsulfatase A-like enzyme|nr:arylsulfatase [Lentisphaerota bacterium]MBT4822805.1 arylsulfatase [Lentisphaerota bacterium]MBT5608981.1 arylsulfatase [Lentisphaerota bacterium]MBT7061507.1 arylsulfatase [Lentisphaerota bacterium]MBT7844801.1 arylsulfatase [Lentisphaerota bacterium]